MVISKTLAIVFIIMSVSFITTIIVVEPALATNHFNQGQCIKLGNNTKQECKDGF